jgi:hypothetical protein
MNQDGRFVPGKAAGSRQSRCAKKAVLPDGVHHVISRQQRHLPLAIAREQFRYEAPDQRPLNKISIDQMKHEVLDQFFLKPISEEFRPFAYFSRSTLRGSQASPFEDFPSAA